MFCIHDKISEDMMPYCFWISSGPPAGEAWSVNKEETIRVENPRGYMYHPFGYSEISDNERGYKVESLYKLISVHSSLGVPKISYHANQTSKINDMNSR